MIASDRAIDFSESAANIGDASCGLQPQQCGCSAFQHRRRTAASGEQKGKRGKHDALARATQACPLRCLIASDFDAARTGIRRYRVAPTAARPDARPLKHLKHEKSTNHQCAASIRLEMTATLRLTQVWVLTWSSRLNEQSRASLSRDFSGACYGSSTSRILPRTVPDEQEARKLGRTARPGPLLTAARNRAAKDERDGDVL